MIDKATQKMINKRRRCASLRWLPWAALSIALMLVTLSLWVARSPAGAVGLATPITGWNSATQLPQAIAGWNAIEQDGRIYLVGGRNSDGDPIANVYMAAILPSGALGGWMETTPLPTALYLHGASATDTHLFVLGGWDGGQTRPEVYSAPFLPGGGIGAWSLVGTYPDFDPGDPIGIDLHGMVIVNGHLYVMGGWTGTQPLRAVRYAAITGGSIGAWQTAPHLPVALYRLAAVAHQGYIYVSGGVTGLDDAPVLQAGVYVARVNANGTLSAWQNATSLPEPRQYHRTVVHDGRLVVLGGRSVSGDLNSVIAANINANGSLSSWSAQPALPQPIYRFAATAVTLYGSDYIFTLGGLQNNSAQSAVYYSTAPDPPTPTPTPTATPTPQPNINLTMDNEPSHWLAPGDEVTYTIYYFNSGDVAVEGATISNVVPANSELIEGSVAAGGTATGSGAGSILSWELGEIDVGQQGSVSYQVRRITPTPIASIPSALQIGVAGPPRVDPGEPIQYTLTITNEVPIRLTDVEIRNTLPDGADYLEGSGGTLNGREVVWQIAEVAPAQPGSPRVPANASVRYAVTAEQTLVNHDYRVAARTDSGSGPTGVGTEILVTQVGDTPPVGSGDGVFVLNDSAAITWQYGGTTDEARAEPVRNPALPSSTTYLPLITRGQNAQ